MFCYVNVMILCLCESVVRQRLGNTAINRSTRWRHFEYHWNFSVLLQ